MTTFKKYEEYVNEITSSGDLKPPRGKALLFNHKKYPELAGEFFDLIQTAYAEIGGHIKIKSPEDVFADPDWNYWEGEDIHGTRDFDMVMFGQRTKFGVKFSGVGHDGTKDAKRAYIEARGVDLKKMGFYIEVSGKIAEILINKYDVPVVTDIDVVTKVLGKQVQWIGTMPDASGDGWYTRNIAGGAHDKIMLGRPRA
jgi:hypothetical protein